MGFSFFLYILKSLYKYQIIHELEVLHLLILINISSDNSYKALNL